MVVGEHIFTLVLLQVLPKHSHLRVHSCLTWSAKRIRKYYFYTTTGRPPLSRILGHPVVASYSNSSGSVILTSWPANQLVLQPAGLFRWCNSLFVQSARTRKVGERSKKCTRRTNFRRGEEIGHTTFWQIFIYSSKNSKRRRKRRRSHVIIY